MNEITNRGVAIEPDYKVAVELFGRELIALNVNTQVELNGSKPLLFFSFMLASTLIAGVMFASIFAFVYFIEPEFVAKLLSFWPN